MPTPGRAKESPGASPAGGEPLLRFDAGLVEQAVLLAIETAPADRQRSFRAARDPLYEFEDPSRREASFEALHAHWFDRLAIAAPLRRLLAEQPSIGRSTAACLVVPAPRRKDEHADLREPRAAAGGDGRPLLVVQLLAETLVVPRRLGSLLRRELLYVADMLDPAFGYDPEVAVRETAGPLAGLLRERHDLLWRISVDGRLAGRGALAEAEAERLRARFESAFEMLAAAGEATFRGLFAGPRPNHGELIQLARHPGGESGGAGECPLCRMPAPRDLLAQATLAERAIAAARRDFPDWRPEEGICPQCADLYELRERARPTTGASSPGC